MRQVTLPKKTAWVVFTLLLLTDAFLDVARRVEGNSLWQPIVTVIGINYVPLLVPLILPLFYVVVKVLGWLVRKVDRLPQAEELILAAGGGAYLDNAGNSLFCLRPLGCGRRFLWLPLD